MSDLFLKPADIDELTGIKVVEGGKPAKIKAQENWLKQQKIRFWINQASRIIVPRAQIEYGHSAQSEPWKPNV